MKLPRFSLLKNFVKKSNRAKLRSMIRGYIRLKKSDELARIAELKRRLSDQKLKIDVDQFSPFIMGKVIDENLKEVCIRQYLLLRLGAHKLNKALLLGLSNNKKIVYPLPKEWRELIDESGFRIAHKRSAILWHIYLLLLIGYGCLRLVGIVLRGIFNLGRESSSVEPYVYFSNLEQGNIPKYKGGNQSYDILSWYVKYSSNNLNFRFIKHDVITADSIDVSSVKVEPSKCGPIPDLSGWKNLFNLSLWGVFAIALSLVDLVRGRWWHALILNEAVVAKKTSMTKPESLAVEYLFHNTNQTYRPLWTYIAEKYGSEITLFFYSTNVENLNIDPTYAWRCMTWPKYLVWDEYQADFIRRSIGNTEGVKIVNSIWFNDDAKEKLPIFDRSIAMFVVTPHRLSLYCTYSEEIDYVVPKNCNAFIQDIFDVAAQLDYKCSFKSKREIGRQISHPHYRHFLNSSFANPNVLVIDPKVSANELINSSSLVISFPFTATSIIAREQGKPSCYYDPSNTIASNHQAAHGIPVIGSKEMLLDWVKSNC